MFLHFYEHLTGLRFYLKGQLLAGEFRRGVKQFFEQGVSAIVVEDVGCNQLERRISLLTDSSLMQNVDCIAG